MGRACEGGLAHEVAAEEEASCDLVGFEMFDDVGAGKAGVLADGEGEGEPRGVAVWCGVGQDEGVLIRAQVRVEGGEVALAGFDEGGELRELRDAEGCLEALCWPGMGTSGKGRSPNFCVKRWPQESDFPVSQ